MARQIKKRAKRTARPLVGGYLERISVVAFEKYHTEITELVKAGELVRLSELR